MTTVPEPVRLLDGELTREMIGAFFDVYNELGHGFVESVYQRALPIALSQRGIASQREAALRVCFRGEPVGDYRADLLVEGRIIVEVKAAERLVHVHELQLLNYLRATELQLGLLVNFGPRATFRRLINTRRRTSPRPSAVVDPRSSAVPL